MFKKNAKQGVEITRLDSFIGSNMNFVGDLTFSDGLRLDGRIEGNVSGAPDEKNLIVLSEHSEIAGSVEAYDAVINGTVRGDLVVTHFLELQSKARITGNNAARCLKASSNASTKTRRNRARKPPKQRRLPWSPVAAARKKHAVCKGSPGTL